MDAATGVGINTTVRRLADELGLNASQVPTGPDRIESAKYQQLLAAAKEAQISVEVRAIPPQSGLPEAMSAGFKQGKKLSAQFEHAVEGAFKGMNNLDFTDPKSLVTVMEHHLAVMSASTYIQFAAKAVDKSTSAVKTLFTAQG
jgi:hypothetical protein